MECLFVHEFSHRKISNIQLIWSIGFYFCNTLGPVLASINQQTTFYIVQTNEDVDNQFDFWQPNIWHVKENLALLLFFWCQYQQFYTHAILAQMRVQQENESKTRVKNSSAKKTPGERVYHVPPDIGLFRYLIAPHYVMEMCCYTMMLAVGAVYVDKVLMTMFVMLNLTDRAYQSKKWFVFMFLREKNNLNDFFVYQ